MSITIETKSVTGILKRVHKWARDVDGKDLKPIVDILTKDYKKQIRAGNDGAGNRMTAVQANTMRMPVRFGDVGSPIRKDVNSNNNPLVATGKTVDSIKSNKKGDGYEIGPSTPHGKKILAINSKGRFTKSTKIVARDPLIVSERQFDIIEKELLKSLEKALK